MRRKSLGFVAVAVIALVAVGFYGVAAGPVQTLTACLKIVPKEPLGTATYSWWDDGKARLEISVAGVAPGEYCVIVDQVKLEVVLLVDDSGAGSLRLDTRWGDSVPLIVLGSNIALKNCPDMTVVICGTFK